MEKASVCHIRTHSVGPSLPINKIIEQFPKSSEIHRWRLRIPSAYRSLQSDGSSSKQRFGHVVAVGCLASESGLMAELETELETEIKAAEEEEEWMREGRLRGRCKERKGMVELLRVLGNRSNPGGRSRERA